MPLNPNIALQTQGIQLPDFAGAYQGILNNRARREGLEQNRQLHQAQMDEYKRKTAAGEAEAMRQQQVRQTLANGGTAQDVMALDPDLGMKLTEEERKSKLFELDEQDKQLGLAAKQQKELASAVMAVKQAKNPAVFLSTVGGLMQSGVVNEKQAAPLIMQLINGGWTPDFEAQLDGIAQSSLSVDKQIELKMKEAQEKRAELEAGYKAKQEERAAALAAPQLTKAVNEAEASKVDPTTGLTRKDAKQLEFQKQTQESLEAYRANSLRISQQNANRIASNQGRVAGQQQTTNEAKLRDDFSAAAKPFKSVSEAYSRVMAAEGDKGVNDIALIYGYMKMLDPGSVVREGEFATAANAAGIPDRISTLYNNAIKGAKLSPQIRQEMKEQAREVYKAAEADFASVEGEYKGIAERSGVDPRNVIINFRSKKDAVGKSQPPKIEILSVK